VARRPWQAGAGLVDALAGVALLAVVAPIALDLLAHTRRLFEGAADRMELQQSVRAAHDVVLRELRLAGLNTDPDGAAGRPDEAIEAAFDGAIVVRYDADRGTPEALVPEAALAAGSPFAAVSTGNDEIVGFVLAKADGPSPDVLAFVADVVPVPRDGVLEQVAVPDVALAQEDPPYTLYRVVVKHGAQTTQRAPVADQVRALRFSYFDRAGLPLAAPGGADDASSRAARAAIGEVRVEVVGMSRRSRQPWSGRAARVDYGLRGLARLRNPGPALVQDPVGVTAP